LTLVWTGSDTDDLQKLFWASYPAHGLLTVNSMRKATRLAPIFRLFDFVERHGWIMEV